MARGGLPPATIASGMEFKLHKVIGQGDVAAEVHHSPRRKRIPAAVVVVPGGTAAVMIAGPQRLDRGVGGISDVAPPGGGVCPPHWDVCHRRPDGQEAPERVMAGVRPRVAAIAA